MNLRIIKLILINIIILNYFNLSTATELIIPKNKPLVNKSDIELNEINYLLPKKKPVLVEKKDLSENDEKKKNRVLKISQNRDICYKL